MTVTENIKKSLKADIESGASLPFRLTLSSIADFYGVSLTPVRSVVDDLVAEGVIRRKDNGRLEILKRRRAKGNKAMVQISKPELKKNWGEIISNEIIERSLKQDTEYLREEATAAKYGVGRTVVRQVFSQLAGAGMVEHIARCGWRVRPFRQRDMIDYLSIREMLELKALELAQPMFKTTELEQLLKTNAPGNEVNKTSLDNSLHSYWIDRCDNWYIQDFFKRYGAFYSALFDYAALDESIRKDMAQEHCDILECLIDKDWRGARNALTRHIQDQEENVLRLIDIK